MSLDDFPRYPLLFGPVAGPPAGPADRAPRRRAAVGQARGLQLRHRVRRQQDPQAGVPGRRRARPGLRHARLDRRRAVQPHPAGRGRRGPGRAEVRAGPGELGRLAGRRLRQGRQHPAQPAGRRRRPAGEGRVRHRVQGELGAGARARSRSAAASRTRSRPARPTTRSAASASPAGPTRWPSRSASSGVFFDTVVVCSVTGSHPGRDGRRLRRAGGRRRPAAAGARHRRLGQAGARPATRSPGSPGAPPRAIGLRARPARRRDRARRALPRRHLRHPRRGHPRRDAAGRAHRGDDHRPGLRGEVDGRD